MNIQKTIKKEWFILVLVLLPYLVVFSIWEHIPNEIPTRWNFKGGADAFADRDLAVILFPLGSLALYILILLVPWLDPKRGVAIEQKPLPELRLFLPLAVTAMFFISVLSTIRSGFNQTHLVFVFITLLMLVLGNYLRTLKPNYFIGIRTPWTLEDADNWKKRIIWPALFGLLYA